MNTCISNITLQGNKIRELKAAKATKEIIKIEVDLLNTYKVEYKTITGKDYEPVVKSATVSDEVIKVVPPTPPTTEGKKDKKDKKVIEIKAKFEIDNNSVYFIPCDVNSTSNFKSYLVANACGVTMKSIPYGEFNSNFPRYPAIIDNNTTIFGTNAICRHLASKYGKNMGVGSLKVENLLDMLEFQVEPLISNKKDHEALIKILNQWEDSKDMSSLLCQLASFPSIKYAFNKNLIDTIKYPYLIEIITRIESLKYFNTSKKMSCVTPLASIDGIDWSTAGVTSSLKTIFTVAIQNAFPKIATALNVDIGIISRCFNASFGDFQCNNAMSMSKSFKEIPFYKGPISPKDIAEEICKHIPFNPLVESVSSAPNGFINIKITESTLVNTLSDIVNLGVRPPQVEHLNVLVDFSSPNIAKEMHVGHLRSTIIGDAISKLLEFVGHDVLRVNHVGDWGTQFGMLISYLMDEYPGIIDGTGESPNITDLTIIYKASKKKFDEDEEFKTRSRANVVRLQAGDADCHKIWNILCDISRAEFQKVYDGLGVVLTEVGESFYNPYIPAVIDELVAKGLAKEDNGMLIVLLPHFDIPLLVRKSDGGYGYDSTDMAALDYRLRILKRDWCIYITDAGQANHFYMCFDAGKEAGWINNNQRLDHIGFGVVQGDDGKRFKTRSSETVRLIDLLDAAKDRMEESLTARVLEGKSSLSNDEIKIASKIIGYGAVKYFDLRQHCSSNYIFSYDRMLDTRGDTAVYLLYSYARVVSILRKAKDDRGIVLDDLIIDSLNLITLQHSAERALAFELLQFGDMIKHVLHELLPNRLCDYLKELSIKFSDFVTKCHVLNADEIKSRVILCEATRRVLKKCFDLIGIETLDKI